MIQLGHPLGYRGGGTGAVDSMQMEELKELHKKVLASGISKLTTVEAFKALFKDLHSHGGICSKLFLGGRKGTVSAGMICVFVSTGVIVATKVKPDLLSYDAACKLVKPLKAACPGLMSSDRELPGDVTGNVSLPGLQHLGNNKDSVTLGAKRCSPLTEPSRDHMANVHALMECYIPEPNVQSQVDVDDILFPSSRFFPRVGEPSKTAATRTPAALQRHEVRSLSLFEVLVLSYHWHMRADQGNLGYLVLGADGWVLETPGGPATVGGVASSGQGQGEETLAQGAGGGSGAQGPESGGSLEVDAVSNRDAADFLRPLVISVVGSREEKVPSLPFWLGDTAVSEKDVLGGSQSYAQEKEPFIVNGLKPKSEEDRKRAEIAVHSGIGAGRGAYSIKALQFMLAATTVPHDSIKEGKVDGYDGVFHDTSYDNREVELTGEGSRPSPLTGVTTDFCMGPDGHHESNHNPACQRKYSGLTGCFDIAGVNLTPHEQNHSKKPVNVRSVNTMNFSNFTYSLRVINEFQNETGYNKRFLAVQLKGAVGHPPDMVDSGIHPLWTCGRCFCENPALRVFDCFGRVQVLLLGEAMST